MASTSNDRHSARWPHRGDMRPSVRHMHSREDPPGLVSASSRLLGERDATLSAMEQWLNDLDALTLDAGTVEIVPIPMDRERAERWRQLAALSGDDWAFVSRSDGSVVAVDEPSELGLSEPEA